MFDYSESLENVIERHVRPNSELVDSTGNYPRENIRALADAGILGLTISKPYGSGNSLADAANVVQRLAGACGSTAMIVLMHYAGTALIDLHGGDKLRRAIGEGRHLTTLALSEVGSRSHFWAPMSRAVREEGSDRVRLDGKKSWITSAGEADSYVWSSRPLTGDGPMSLWLVPSTCAGLSEPGRFDGFGLRGNRSAPVEAVGVAVPEESMLGEDGTGLEIALTVVLPWFLILSGAFSLGVMQSCISETGDHIRMTRFEHVDQRLVDQPAVRADHARMQIATDQVAALLQIASSAVADGDPRAPLYALEIKAAAGEAAINVTELAMKICGGAAFRKELSIERHFRDSRAARVMAPTTDALLDFIGRAINGMELL